MFTFDSNADDDAKARRDYVTSDTKNQVSKMMASNDNAPPNVANDPGGWFYTNPFSSKMPFEYNDAYRGVKPGTPANSNSRIRGLFNKP